MIRLETYAIRDCLRDFERDGRQVGDVAIAPGAPVVLAHHVSPEVALLRSRWLTLEGHPHCRVIVGQQFGEIARRHAVAQSRLGLVLRRRSPQRRAQSRHQQKGQQRQRQCRGRQGQRRQQGARQAGFRLRRLQCPERGECRQQAKRHDDGGDQPLVEQQRRHQGEAGEADARPGRHAGFRSPATSESAGRPPAPCRARDRRCFRTAPGRPGSAEPAAET